MHSLVSPLIRSFTSSSLFFYSYGHHRDLHSFPTRRSSDLPDRVHDRLGYMPDFFGVYDQLTAGEYLDFYAACYRQPKDRKSTRLNSSHANISYAVFCLKKKKKTDRTKTNCDK